MISVSRWRHECENAVTICQKLAWCNARFTFNGQSCFVAQNGLWGLHIRAEFDYRMSPRGTEREPGLGWMWAVWHGAADPIWAHCQIKLGLAPPDRMWDSDRWPLTRYRSVSCIFRKYSTCWLRKHIHYEWALNGYSQPKIYNYNRNYNH